MSMCCGFERDRHVGAHSHHQANLQPACRQEGPVWTYGPDEPLKPSVASAPSREGVVIVRWLYCCFPRTLHARIDKMVRWPRWRACVLLHYHEWAVWASSQGGGCCVRGSSPQISDARSAHTRLTNSCWSRGSRSPSAGRMSDAASLRSPRMATLPLPRRRSCALPRFTGSKRPSGAKAPRNDAPCAKRNPRCIAKR